jgi:hypothetical protein
MPPRSPRIQPVNPDEPGHIAPRLPGESAYQYRYRRSLGLYGQTPYQRRIFLAQRRGQTTSQARGHGRQAGETESQRRNRISLEDFGLTVSQRRRSELRGWLVEHGYTPETTGMTWTQLLRVAARLRWMYDATGPAGRVTPAMIAEATALERNNTLQKGWAFERLWRKYDDMQQYREFRDRQPGRESWSEYQAVHDFVPTLAVQWWYYH